MFVEADPSGGSLALRYQLSVELGLVTLAAAVRAGIDQSSVWNQAQLLPGGLPAVLGPETPDQVNSVLASTGAALGRFLSNLEAVDVIVDLGRLGTGTHAAGFLDSADLLLMVARPVAEQLQPAAHRLQSLGLPAERLGWVLVGERPHSTAEVEQAFGLRVAGVIADDQRGAKALAGESAGSSRIRRSALARSASSLADELARRTRPATDASHQPDANTEAVTA